MGASSEKARETIVAKITERYGRFSGYFEKGKEVKEWQIEYP